MKSSVFLFSALILSALAVSATAQAQGGPGGRQRGDRFLKELTAELALTAEQREQVDRVIQDNRLRNQDEREHMVVAKGELQELIKTENFDEAAARKTVSKLSDFREEMMMNHLRTMHQIRKVLTPEQRETLDRYVESRRFGGAMGPHKSRDARGAKPPQR